jgi:hypothetical protein
MIYPFMRSLRHLLILILYYTVNVELLAIELSTDIAQSCAYSLFSPHLSFSSRYIRFITRLRSVFDTNLWDTG